MLLDNNKKKWPYRKFNKLKRGEYLKSITTYWNAILVF